MLTKFKAILFLFLICLLGANAQNRNELEKKIKDYRTKIEYANQLLEQNKKKQTVTSSSLNLILGNIENRKTIISNLETELENLNKRINNNTFVLGSLTADLERLKLEYERLIYNAYLNQKSTNIWLFIFASESFNQFYRRYQYLKEYTKFRRKQRELIYSVKELIERKNQDLIGVKEKKQSLLFVYSEESTKLRKEINQKERAISHLKSKEKELLAEIAKNRKSEKALANEIARLIEEEKKVSASQSAINDRISKEFLKSSGKLNWPLSEGIIISKYGSHPHPVLKDIEINNPGIELSTVQNALVYSVYDGVVSGIYGIYGANNTVIVKHGNFYTVYQNVIDLRVKTGTNLVKGDIIGRVYTDQSNGDTVLGFQIWNGKQTVNPVEWIKNN
jgi:murein hydrolase activator